ncbi:hypothetical protein EJD97_015839 [Solanum chilense]|uniref:Uncharacterized protein n=1 Tax=Solanum chilense TaxID=4083 RepID=A0A6N2BDZ7_SOLCI|nr:hypothetical protein EJD97_015839 [Solanum chilense]
MSSHNLIDIKSRIILGSVGRLHRDKLSRLSQSANNNPYRFMLYPTSWKKNHEVHINGLPFPCRNLNNLSQTTRLKMSCLDLLKIRKLCNISCNVLLHAIPPIDLPKIMIHLGVTCMYGISRTMILCHNPGPLIIHIWYT